MSLDFRMGRFVLLVILFSLGHRLLAQTLPPFQFHRPGQRDGLHLYTIASISQDRIGSLWIGTKTGIVRFDGLHAQFFKHYRKKDGFYRGYQARTSTITPDGTVWFTTEAGLTAFDPKTSTPQLLEAPEIQNPHFLAADEAGNLLVESVDSIYWLDKNRNAHAVKSIPGFPPQITHTDARPREFYTDPKGKGVWISTTKGMLHLAFENGKTKRMAEPVIDRWTSGRKGMWIISRNKEFWWEDADSSKLYKIDRASGKVLFALTTPAGMKATSISTLLEDRQGNIWFASPLRKNYVYRKATGTFYPLVYDPLNSGTFPSARILDLFENQDGSVWMGTEDGLVVYEPGKDWISIYPVLNPADTHAVKQRIHSVKSDGSEWWMACTEGRVIRLNPETGEKKTFVIPRKLYPDLGEKEPLPHVYNLHRFRNTWMVGTKSGLVFLQSEKERWFTLPDFQGEYWDHLIYGMASENDSILWIKLHMAGVNRVNLNRMTWQHYGNLSDAELVEGETWGFCNLFKGPGGKIFVDDFSSKRLAAYDPVKNRFVVDKRLKVKWNGVDAFTLFSSSNGKDKIWQVVYPLGIFELDYKTATLNQCLAADSTEFIFFKSCHFGPDGRLWIADQNVVGFMDPGTRKYTTLRAVFGSHENNYDTHFENLPDGRILVNTYYDLAIIRPDRVQGGLGGLRPILSQVTVNGTNFSPIQAKGEVLQLRHDQNFIQLQFGLLTAVPENLELEYSLNNGAFELMDESRNLSFFSLASGRYNLVYRVRNKDGSWKSQDFLFQFHISPAFYQTWWFIGLIASLLGFGLFWYLRTKWDARDQLFALEAKALTLEKEKTIVQYESLKQQLNPHFLFNSLTSLGSLIRIDPKMAASFLEAMSKSYRYILKSQDQELVSLSDELTFIQTFIKLQEVRFEEALKVRIEVPDDSVHLKIVPVTLQNLIENAIKHNIVDVDSPLVIRIFVEGGYLHVENNLQKKSFVETSNKRGLQNLISLYRYLDSRPITIEESSNLFRISIPLI